MNIDNINIMDGQKVLLFMSNKKKIANYLIPEMKRKVGFSGFVETELLTADSDKISHEASEFDVCILCFDDVNCHTEDLLAEVARILKPGGTLWLEEHTTTRVSSSKINSNIQQQERVASLLKMNGFVDITTEVDYDDFDEPANGKFVVCYSIAKKPNFEIGAVVPLTLLTLKKNGDATNDLSAAQVWTLSANDLIDDEILDSDTILEESDKKKPDPASLRVDCGSSSGKLKACKNCNCGVAEELAKEKATLVEVGPDQKTSSCGSCYLGDAFRCASCPYLGMPAFKPGEKVQLPQQ